MSNLAGAIRIGTGGWEHDAYDEAFYGSGNLTTSQKLSFYARHFSTVEVRQTFWDADLGSADAADWCAAVQDARDFRFHVKLHSSFTHRRDLSSAVAANIRGMLQAMARRDRLGSLLVQFPYACTNTSRNRYHLQTLAQLFAGFPISVEFRHESWRFPGLQDLLRENSLTLVSADLPRIRQFMPFVNGATGESSYLRLHGRNEKGWLLNGHDARYDYLYNAREVKEIQKRLEALSPRVTEITVIANNTTGAKSIPLVFQLAAAIRGGRPVPVPAATLAAFPMLRSIAQTDEEEIPALNFDGAYRSAI
jgi:uncharacterized protein YecE (DUF72 family)